MNIPEEAIEKAARALYASFDGGNEPPLNWDKDLDREGQDNVRNFARAALSAAAPHLMAMGYDEGCDEAASSRFDAHECKKYNPYRKEAL